MSSQQGLDLVARFYMLIGELDPQLDDADPDDPDLIARMARIVDEYSADLIHPELEFRSYFVAAEGGKPYLGRDGLVAWHCDIAASFSRFRRELVEQHEIGADVVVVRQHVQAVGRRSGMALETDAWIAVRFEDERLRVAEVFIEREPAFAAAAELARGER